MRALSSSPEKVEDGLGGGQDVEGHRECQALAEVGQVELGASKLPLHISIVLGAGRKVAVAGSCWPLAPLPTPAAHLDPNPYNSYLQCTHCILLPVLASS